MKADKRQSGFAPFWNYRQRLILFYLGPFCAFALVLPLAGLQHGGEGTRWWEFPWIGWQAIEGRDFWVPFLWGFWMPWFNGPNSPVSGMKRIVFRDFNGNPTLPLAIPLMHGLTWATCTQLPIPVFVMPFLFAAAFLLYDILMLRYDLLQIWSKQYAAPIRARGVLKSPLVLWWLYLATGLALVHRFGNDSPLFVLGSAVVLIAPMQLLLYANRRKNISINAKRVAVIGAGWTGLYVTKWLKQAGIEVRVFESTDHVGGLWKYDEQACGGVSETTFASSSNYYMHASDFPMETVYFPKHKEIQGFLDQYADHFQLRDCVTFNASVNSVAKQNDRWTLTADVAGDTVEEQFDAVVVASGFNRKPQDFDTRYAGFEGSVMHSSEYKHSDQLLGNKSILVVGLGESGADIAHEAAQIRGAQVYCSGSKQWFAGRFVSGDFPADTLMAPGIRTLLSPFFNQEIKGRRFVGRMIRVIWGRGGSGVPVWEPPAPWLHGFVTKSRATVADVHDGNIVPKGRVAKCCGKTVEFEDGSTAEIDLILDCTGFAPEFPFLEHSYCFTKQYRLAFYREDPTLAFAGTARPVLGSIPGLAEMQARWIAAVFAGRAQLPEKLEQEHDEFFHRRAHRKRFYTSEKRPNLVDHEFYAQSIARELKVSVPWFRLLLTRPKDFWMLVQSPWTAFKYCLRDDRQQTALERIRRFMPKNGFYYSVIRGHFVWTGIRLAVTRLLFLALAIVAVPWYILALVGGVFLAQLIERNFSRSLEADYIQASLAAPTVSEPSVDTPSEVVALESREPELIATPGTPE